MFEYEFMVHFNKYKYVYNNDKNKKYEYIIMIDIKKCEYMIIIIRKK